MNIVGRNDHCSCGSGRKYKKCHGAATLNTTDAGYERIRRLDGESASLLMKFAKQRYGEDALEIAWHQFLFSDEIPFDMSHPESDYFLRWFNFNWKPEEAETLAELCLAETGSKLDRDLHRFIEATVRAPYSFFQTLEVEPGKELTLRDVVRRFEVRVKEKSASTILQRGQILFARVVEMDGILFLMGNGSHSIPPLFLGHMLALRTTLERTQPPAVSGTIPLELLLDREGELREVYFRIVDEAENPKLEVQNTDGDRLELHSLSYEIPSLDVAFRALKDLEANVTGKTDDELLAEAERDEAGKPTRVWIYCRRCAG